MSIKKTFITSVCAVAGICAIMAASLISCQKKQAPAASADGSVAPAKSSISVAVWDYVEGEDGYYADVIKAFQVKYPNIKVEVIAIPASDYTTKLSVMLNGGSNVDAFWIKDGDTTKGLATRGQLADLAGYVQKDSIDLSKFKGLAERFMMNGKQVALPASTAYYVMYYNKDIFDKAGVPYPSNDMTWDQWEQLAAQLTSGSGVNKIYGAHLHTWNALVQNWTVQDGKHTIVEKDYGFMKDMYDRVVRMQNAGTLWPYGELRAGSIGYNSAFQGGTVAMMPMGTWYYATIINAIKKGESKTTRWGIATIPHPAGVPAGWTVGSVTPIAINQASKNKDAAWEFLKFVTGTEGASIYTKYGQFAGSAGDTDLAVIASADGMPEGSLAGLTVKNISLDRPMVDKVAEINTMLGEEHSLIMLGETPVEKGLANMAKRAKEILQ
jgi:multiple sugar transport system substrate-binding protein